MKKIFFLIIFSFLICLPAWAHQPYLVGSNSGVVEVKDPEVSKAYYGILSGEPQYYEINSATAFQLYLNILIPAVAQTNRNMLVEVFQNNETGVKLYTLDGSKFDWTPFFEDFARDNYFKGPELRAKVSAGIYLIKVSSSDNQGRYSLAVGEAESFPPAEILRSLLVLPQIKEQIFNKPAITAFFNIFGLFVWVPLFIIIVAVIVAVYILKRRNKK
jgi:hypothetical protein